MGHLDIRVSLAVSLGTAFAEKSEVIDVVLRYKCFAYG
jgi:hypothetical protein